LKNQWLYFFGAAYNIGNLCVNGHCKETSLKLTSKHFFDKTIKMKVAKSEIAKHIFIIGGIMAILSFCIVYPFLPGEYDMLAMPISIMVQSFGAIGLPLSVVGLLWLIMPKRHFVFAKASLFLCTFIVLILAVFAFLGAGKALGVITLLIWGRHFLTPKSETQSIKRQVLALLHAIFTDFHSNNSNCFRQILYSIEQK
jgi:hypothetical protein